MGVFVNPFGRQHRKVVGEEEGLRIVAGDRADLRSLLAHLHRIAVATETVFSRTTDTPCRVTIKQLEHDVLQVFDLKRSQGKSRRHVIDRVEENSDFEAICSGSGGTLHP